MGEGMMKIKSLALAVCVAALAFLADATQDVPELLVLSSGERIATSEQWERIRRPEIVRTLLEQE